MVRYHTLIKIIQTNASNICMTAKYKRSTPALSVVRDTDENDVTGGVEKY